MSTTKKKAFLERLTNDFAITETTEGLTKAYVLPVTSRILISLCLLPALQQATGLRRVVSVFAAGYEGPFDESDWAGYGSKHPLGARGHMASMITMAHNTLARRAPDVSFIHNYPGAVKTNFGKDAKGFMVAVRAALVLLGPLFLKYRSIEESSVVQLYCATSAAFPPADGGDGAGVPVPEGMAVSVGADGETGSGSYNLNAMCERASDAVQTRLGEAKKSGAEERLWAHIVGEIKEITGKDY